MSGDTSLSAMLSDQPEESTQVDEQETGVDSAAPAEVEEHHEERVVDDPIEKHRKGLEAGIAAERKRRQEIEQRAHQLEAELQKYRQVQQPRKQAEPNLVRPKRDEFQDQESYEDALLEYGDQRRELRQEQARREQEETQRAQQIEQTANEVIETGRKLYPDFDQVINTGIGPYLAHESQQSSLFRQALLTGERSHEVAYYLGRNPDETARIYAMPPLQMVRAISLIEATKLTAQESEQEPAQQKPNLPRTLTQSRDARSGQFRPAQYDGPTPLDAVLATKR